MSDKKPSNPEVVPARFTKIQRPYGEREVGGIDTGEESKVWQASKDETDVNVIMANYARTGNLTHTNNRPPMYGDFSQEVDLQTAFKIVENAKLGFNQMPPEARFLAGNDPVRFVQMIMNPENREAFEKAGIRFDGHRTDYGSPPESPDGTNKTP